VTLSAPATESHANAGWLWLRSSHWLLFVLLAADCQLSDLLAVVLSLSIPFPVQLATPTNYAVRKLRWNEARK